MKEGTGRDTHNITEPKGIESHASFEVEIPAFGDFERQMEFQANLQPTDPVCTN